jgi:porin
MRRGLKTGTSGHRHFVLVLLAVVGLLLGGPSFDRYAFGETEESDSATKGKDNPRFGGPDTVDVQMKLDALTLKTALQRYTDWKAQLAEKHGFSYGIDYSAVYFGASDSPGEDETGGGMVRFYGSWDLVGRQSGNTGAVVWKGEHRHAYTDVAPGDFGFNLGYAGLIEPPFSDQGLRLTNLYWRQRLNQGRVALVGGWVDPTDYVDVYALASPWTGFMNFAFSTGTLTIPVPNEGLGLGAAGMITDNVFVIGGFADSNSDPADPGEGFDTFFNTHEYFKHIEIGWTTSQDMLFLNNIHFTLWHADEREEAQVLDGWGANFSFSRYINDRWLPFVRAGYADDGGSLMQKSVAAGFGYQWEPGNDLVGLGLNWGEPNETTFEPGLDNQWTTELFYRWQISRELAITPDVQWLVNPALNPEEDQIWVFGLRARLAF